eukprot:m.162349 g.162349  ORF g.162349 m.162349 type:complete len:474 (+) comp14601_c0_seq1:13-1434(+)
MSDCAGVGAADESDDEWWSAPITSTASAEPMVPAAGSVACTDTRASTEKGDKPTTQPKPELSSAAWETLIETARRGVLAPFHRQAADELARVDQISIAKDLDVAVHAVGRSGRAGARAETAAEIVVQACWTRNSEHADGWANSPGWRMSYVVGQTVVALCKARVGDQSAAIQRLDLAIITGGPSSELRELITMLAPPSTALAAAQRQLSIKPPQNLPSYPSALSVQRVNYVADTPAAERKATFYDSCFSGQNCGVIHGLQVGWTAAAVWGDIVALTESHGHRWVPIEVGTWPNLEERLVTVRQFFEEYFRPDIDTPATPAYLAQHNLFEQVPELQGHVSTPQWINDVGGSLLEQSVWWGTSGTRTPLHYDTHDNFLAQVVGYKYVRLYAASQTPHLYAGTPRVGGGGVARYKTGVNMSQIGDVETASLDDFPNLALAEFSDVVLGPGDTLYMPAGTWHYVRSLTPSMSVNFWF